MNVFLIFAVVWAAFLAISFWESSVEGRNAWDKGKLGWKIRFSKNLSLTRYHFFLFFVTIPLLLFLPLFVYGWDTKLFGILLSAFFSGLVLEDFMWFVVNPAVKFSEFNEKFADYYPWLNLGIIKIPGCYVFDISIAVLSWVFLWR